jgi:autotransporter adhesin
MALGYSASATATGGIAIGIGAQATALHSIALGGGSIAERGGQTDYVAPYMSTPQNSGGEVSVGSTTDGQRQITNVAAGSAATDAVNVAQLQGAVEPLATNVGTLTTGLATLTTDVGTLSSGLTSLGSDVAALSGRVDALGSRLEDTRDIAIAAGALSMAAAQLRFDDRLGKISIAMGGGAFHGQGAGAIGVGYTSSDRLWRANVSGSFTEGESALGGGVSFTLN